MAPSRHAPSSVHTSLQSLLLGPTPYARLTRLGAAAYLLIPASSDLSMLKSPCPLASRSPPPPFPPPPRAAFLTPVCSFQSSPYNPGTRDSRAVPTIRDRPKLGRHAGEHRDTAPTSLLFLRGDEALSTSRMRGPSPSTCCPGPTRGSLRAAGCGLADWSSFT